MDVPEKNVLHRINFRESQQWMAKYRFDEVVLYFEKKEEQEEFHQLIESNPKIVE